MCWIESKGNVVKWGDDKDSKSKGLTIIEKN